MLTGSVTLDEAVENANISASLTFLTNDTRLVRTQRTITGTRTNTTCATRAVTTINAYVARLCNRSSPDRTTVTAIRIPTAVGASTISQRITTIDTSLTEAKNVTNGRRFSSASTVVAAAKRMIAKISANRSPCAAAAMGFTGTMLISVCARLGTATMFADAPAPASAKRCVTASRTDRSSPAPAQVRTRGRARCPPAVSRHP